MEKSYVTMEQKVCPVCGRKFETNALLLDKRLKERFERYTVTGWALCPEHDELKSRGFVALVACDAEKSGLPKDGGTLKPENAYRTGAVVHVKADIFKRLFGQEPPPGMLVFCEDEVIKRLEEMEKRNKE